MSNLEILARDLPAHIVHAWNSLDSELSSGEKILLHKFITEKFQNNQLPEIDVSESKDGSSVKEFLREGVDRLFYENFGDRTFMRDQTAERIHLTQQKNQLDERLSDLEALGRSFRAFSMLPIGHIRLYESTCKEKSLTENERTMLRNFLCANANKELGPSHINEELLRMNIRTNGSPMPLTKDNCQHVEAFLDGKSVCLECGHPIMDLFQKTSPTPRTYVIDTKADVLNNPIKPLSEDVLNLTRDRDEFYQSIQNLAKVQGSIKQDWAGFDRAFDLWKSGGCDTKDVLRELQTFRASVFSGFHEANEARNQHPMATRESKDIEQDKKEAPFDSTHGSVSVTLDQEEVRASMG